MLSVSVKPLDDVSESNKAVAKVVEILNSISHVAQSEYENSVPDYTISEEALHEVYQCLSKSPSKQVCYILFYKLRKFLHVTLSLQYVKIRLNFVDGY